LIVDYIFDWARDIYREAIIEELRSLAINNTSSLGNDSDVFSLVDRVAFHPQLPEIEELNDDEETNATTINRLFNTNAKDPLKAFDSLNGVLRDASYIRSRFMALYITEDNLSILIKSMKTPDKERKVAENVLRSLKDAWRVTREALDTLELTWTGEDRENMSLFSPQKVFLVTVTLSAYLSPDWEQTRELCCLAVSEGALEELFQYANLKPNQRWLSSDLPWIEDEILVGNFQAFLSMPMKANLLASISRASVSSKLFTEKRTGKEIKEEKARGTWWLVSAERVPGNIRYRFDAAVMPDSQALNRGLVSSIYNLHKIGRAEPSSSILRVSSRLDQQNLSDQPSLNGSMWPGLDPAVVLGNQEQEVVFVTSKTPGNVPQHSEFCIFLMDIKNLDHILDQNKPEEPETISKFQAMRMDSKPGWGSGWNRSDVQKEDLDFFDNKRRFMSYLQKLTIFAKYRQGETTEPHTPTKVWNPKKKFADWQTNIVEPQSWHDIWKLRNMLQASGNRITSIMDRQRSVAPDEIPTQTDLEMLGKHDPRPIGFMEAPWLDEDQSHVREEEALEAYPEVPSTKQNKGKGRAVSSPVAIPTLVLRDNHAKRSFDPSDQEMASSSAGPSKRPRRESLSHFQSDVLNDEELSMLIENGAFA